MRLLLLLRYLLLGRYSREDLQRAQAELRMAQEALRASQERYSRATLDNLIARSRQGERHHDQ